MSNYIKELVSAFNMSNYFCDRVNTNFTVEDRKICGLFAHGTGVTGYLRWVGEEIIKQQYLGSEVVAGKYYNLNCFPFVLSANPIKKESGIGGVMKVEFVDSTNKEVIRNLKIHLVNEFRRAVTLKVIARLVEAAGITEEEGHEWVGGTVKTGAFDESDLLKGDYLYCIAFESEYFEKEGYDLETFELFKGMYIQEFNSRLRACGLKNSDFYHDKDDMLYIKDVDEKVVKHIAKYVKKEAALDFRTPGKEDFKVENFKDVLSSLISKYAKKPIDSYEYDVFTDKKEIKSGSYFVLVPLTKVCGGQLESLKPGDVYNINTGYTNLVDNIKGKTEKSHISNCKNPVYAISNRGIAQLLPEIMKFPVAYNERFGRFEFAADLGQNSKLDFGFPRHVSSVSSPVPQPHHQEQGTGETIGVAIPGVVDTKNNPGPSMSDQNPDEDESYGSMKGLPDSLKEDLVCTLTTSITLKPKDDKNKSDDSDVVLVYDSQEQERSGADSKSELLCSESNLSDASISSSIHDTEVYQQFVISPSRIGSNKLLAVENLVRG